VLQRPSRFVTEVPPDLYEIWSLEEEAARLPGNPAPELSPVDSAGADEDDGGDGGGGEPGGYLN
jgi:hypothetical protein